MEAQEEAIPDAPAPAEPKQEEQEHSMIREAAIGKGTQSSLQGSQEQTGAGLEQVSSARVRALLTGCCVVVLTS